VMWKTDAVGTIFETDRKVGRIWKSSASSSWRAMARHRLPGPIKWDGPHDFPSQGAAITWVENWSTICQLTSKTR
jgi:hypothetical protein